MSTFQTITCPTCFESFAIPIDLSAGSEQSFVVDCEICCRPIQVVVSVDGTGEVHLSASAE